MSYSKKFKKCIIVTANDDYGRLSNFNAASVFDNEYYIDPKTKVFTCNAHDASTILPHISFKGNDVRVTITEDDVYNNSTNSTVINVCNDIDKTGFDFITDNSFVHFTQYKPFNEYKEDIKNIKTDYCVVLLAVSYITLRLRPDSIINDTLNLLDEREIVKIGDVSVLDELNRMYTKEFVDGLKNAVIQIAEDDSLDNSVSQEVIDKVMNKLGEEADKFLNSTNIEAVDYNDQLKSMLTTYARESAFTLKELAHIYSIAPGKDKSIRLRAFSIFHQHDPMFVFGDIPELTLLSPYSFVYPLKHIPLLYPNTHPEEIHDIDFVNIFLRLCLTNTIHEDSYMSGITVNSIARFTYWFERFAFGYKTKDIALYIHSIEKLRDIMSEKINQLQVFHCTKDEVVDAKELLQTVNYMNVKIDVMKTIISNIDYMLTGYDKYKDCEMIPYHELSNYTLVHNTPMTIISLAEYISNVKDPDSVLNNLLDIWACNNGQYSEYFNEKRFDREFLKGTRLKTISSYHGAYGLYMSDAASIREYGENMVEIIRNNVIHGNLAAPKYTSQFYNNETIERINAFWRRFKELANADIVD